MQGGKKKNKDLNAPPVAPLEQDAEDGIPLLDQSGNAQTIENVLDLEESSGEEGARKHKAADANDHFLFIDDSHSPESPHASRDKRENSV